MKPNRFTRPHPSAGPATTTCAAVGCQHTINHRLLMCIEHWRMVPAALRRQVQASWARIGHDPDARSSHLKAVQDAVRAVRDKQMARGARRDAGTGRLF